MTVINNTVGPTLDLVGNVVNGVLGPGNGHGHAYGHFRGGNDDVSAVPSVFQTPPANRNDEDEQQRIAMERNIQASSRNAEAGRGQVTPHGDGSLRGPNSADAISAREALPLGERRGNTAPDMARGEPWSMAALGGSAVRPSDMHPVARPTEARGETAMRLTGGLGGAAGVPPVVDRVSYVAAASAAAGAEKVVTGANLLASSVAASSFAPPGAAGPGPVPAPIVAPQQANGSTRLAVDSVVVPAVTSPPGPARAPLEQRRSDIGIPSSQVPAGSSAERTAPAATERVVIGPDTIGDRVEPAAAVGVLMEPASEDAVADAQVARRAAAIAATYRAFGEVEAARDVRARTREVSPALAGEVLLASRVTVESIFAAFGTAAGGGERIERVDPIHRWDNGADRAALYDQVAADLAGTIEHAAHGPRGERVTHDMATLILDALGQGDEYRLSAFAMGVPFGTGLALPLALAEELGRRGDRQRQRLVLLSVEQALKRLKERIAGTVRALIDLTSPLAAYLSAGSRAEPGERGRLLQLLRAYVARDPHIVSAFEDGERRVDAVGHDAFFALDALRRNRIAAALHAARIDLTASAATAFAIAQSASARQAVQASSDTVTADEEFNQAPTSLPTRTQRVYASLGFSAARSSLLAHATLAYSAKLMEARWAALNSTHDLDRQNLVFEAMLRFAGAHAIDPSDVGDQQTNRPACGLPLYRSLEQAA